MPAQRCPNCKLVNPQSAVSCDCGYSFRYKDMGNARVQPGQQATRTAGERMAIRIAIRLGVFAIILIAAWIYRGR
jgi:hypothetical protein